MLHRHVGAGGSHEERLVVVLEIGAALTKVGFSGDYYPRHVCKSEVKNRINGETMLLSRILSEKKLVQADLERFISDMLQYLYYKVLLMHPRERRLCIVESAFQPTVVRNAMVEIVMNQLGVNLVSFIPSPCACCLTIAKSTALVIDVGWIKSTIIPVVEGVAMIMESEVLLAGANSIQQKIEENILEHSMLLLPDNVLLKASEQPLLLTPQVIEHIMIRTCFVSPFERAQKFADPECKDFKHAPSLELPLQANEILQVTGLTREFSAESLFSFNGDESSLGSLVLEVINHCPIDVRKELLGNIILVGGTTHLPGFKHRLMCEIKHQLTVGPKAEKFANNKFVAIHSQPCKPVNTNWLGASLAANSESPHLKYISMKEYKLDKSIAFDWSVPRKTDL